MIPKGDLPSEKIKEFLDYLRKCREGYDISVMEEEELNKQTQDILHKIELEEVAYHEHARINKELAEIRKKRRKAKDMIIMMKPIFEYMENNKNHIDKLSQLLGTVRKEEKRLENRMYIPKSGKYGNGGKNK